MNLIQALNRIGQQLTGWHEAIADERHQFKLVEKMYNKNGLSIRCTCHACPEQYDVTLDLLQVGYIRLRHGHFRVHTPNVRGKIVYEASPDGDGIFETYERLTYMTIAMRKILENID